MAAADETQGAPRATYRSRSLWCCRAVSCVTLRCTLECALCHLHTAFLQPRNCQALATFTDQAYKRKPRLQVWLAGAHHGGRSAQCGVDIGAPPSAAGTHIV